MMDNDSNSNYSSSTLDVDFSESHTPVRSQNKRNVRLEAAPFLAHTVDQFALIWDLRVNVSGEAVLMLNQEIVANLTRTVGHAILTTGEPPFELAEDLLEAITSANGIQMLESVRADLEYDLSRWIPEHFCCCSH